MQSGRIVSLIWLVFLLNQASECAINYNFTRKLNKFRVKRAGCEQVNPKYMYTNTSCYLKPTRDGCGLTTLLVWTKAPVNDFWINIVIYYKFGHVFRPWMFRYDIDICSWMSGRSWTDPLSEKFKAGITKAEPLLLHPCPYDGVVGLNRSNFAQFFEDALPNIVPSGTYKISTRAYKKETNETYGIVFGIAEVTATDILKSYDMG